MSDDSSASVAEVTSSPGARRKALAPGPWYWQAQAKDQLRVRLLYVPGNKIDVGIWWNRPGRDADVQLVFGLYGDSVELGCLTGNGFDAPGFHRLGFGTFAVNIAVQALQATCRPSLAVQGVLSNTAEAKLAADERARLEANRRAFWRRFGLDVVTLGAPPLDYLRGRVGALQVVTAGSVAGQFPRCIALGEFVAERPAGFW
ncbi:hypothetical protein SBBP1_430036 [Burkholderiales bacterium]|nr:hypothetical protein SBBP1_430036 [Burkholderiales bacterium]